MAGKRCTICGKQGHTAGNCPMKNEGLKILTTSTYKGGGNVSITYLDLAPALLVERAAKELEGAGMAGKRCTICGKQGHTAGTCPNRVKAS